MVPPYIHMCDSRPHPIHISPRALIKQHHKADGCTGVASADVNVFMISDGLFFLVGPCSASCPHPPVFQSEFQSEILLCFLVLIIKTNCIFLEEERVCVFTVAVSLLGTVSLAVSAFSQKPVSLALLSSTPATSGYCRLPKKKEEPG